MSVLEDSVDYEFEGDESQNSIFDNTNESVYTDSGLNVNAQEFVPEGSNQSFGASTTKFNVDPSSFGKPNLGSTSPKFDIPMFLTYESLKDLYSKGFPKNIVPGTTVYFHPELSRQYETAVKQYEEIRRQEEEKLVQQEKALFDKPRYNKNNMNNNNNDNNFGNNNNYNQNNNYDKGSRMNRHGSNVRGNDHKSSRRPDNNNGRFKPYGKNSQGNRGPRNYNSNSNYNKDHNNNDNDNNDSSKVYPLSFSGNNNSNTGNNSYNNKRNRPRSGDINDRLGGRS